MDPLKIIQKYYSVDSPAYKLLIPHSQAVAKKALEIASHVPQLKPDLKFIAEAAMLHDIGIFLTDDRAIGCFGDQPYIRHGYLGREILEKEGFPRHALVCERHVGLGISAQEIITHKLPLPPRDMVPVSVEEKIICLADKFFSKDEEVLDREKSLDRIKGYYARFGVEKLELLDGWLKEFGV